MRTDALSSPTANIGHENIAIEMQLGLYRDPPSARAITVIEPIAQPQIDRTHRTFVRSRGPRRGEQLPFDDLRDEIVRNLQQVLIRRRSLRRLRHDSIVRAAPLPP